MDENSINSGAAARITESDEANDLLLVPFRTVDNVTSLAVEAVQGSRIITLLDATGVILDTHITIFSDITNRFFLAHVTEVLGGNAFELNVRLDSTFPAGSFVDIGTVNVNVAGTAAAPIEYAIRSTTGSINKVLRITRVMLQMTTSTAPDFAKFGDINNGLKYGLSLVYERSTGVRNIGTARTNADLSLIAFDYIPYDASNPGLGVYGIGLRLTFAGPSKMGAVVSLAPDENLKIVVQDDLSSLLSLRILAEGHVSSKYIL